MLVLSRKAGQELVIAGRIRITVSKIAGNRVKLGIEAPGDVSIIRGELDPIVRTFDSDCARGSIAPRTGRRAGSQ